VKRYPESLSVLGADLTGDGKDEIAIWRSNREPGTEVWSIGADLQVEVLVQMDQPLHSVADLDGDGRVELLVGGADFKGTVEEAFAGTAEFFSRLAVWEVEQSVWTSVLASQIAARHLHRLLTLLCYFYCHFVILPLQWRIIGTNWCKCCFARHSW